jgi:hypothetical protein
VFYMKLNKFCSTCDITILLIVACIVIYVSSNHVVYSMVVELFLYFIIKFTFCIVSSHFVCFCLFLFLPLFSLCIKVIHIITLHSHLFITLFAFRRLYEISVSVGSVAQLGR